LGEGAGAVIVVVGLAEGGEVFLVVDEVAVEIAEGVGLGGREAGEADAVAGFEGGPVGEVDEAVAVEVASGKIANRRQGLRAQPFAELFEVEAVGEAQVDLRA
jgi:hypothetical protein